MELEHTFTVPRPADEVFRVLRDVERIAPCMPGATLDTVDGDEFAGRVKVKVGPMQLTYSGTARFVAVDEDARRATLEAVGKETRGGGRASATVTTELTEDGSETAVRVRTDLSITGRPAQFGRSVMADVGDKLLGQFADCLAAEMGRGDGQPEPAGAAVGAAATGGAAEPDATGVEANGTGVRRPERVLDLSEHRPTPEAIDLVQTAGLPALRRAAPLLAGAALLGVLFWLLRRATR